MCEISVIMTQSKEESYVSSAIVSILNQSFTDFEILFSKTSTPEEILSLASSFCDQRIRILSGNDFFKAATGKYIAFMHADYRMQVDRLKLQYAFMEAAPSITVCASRIKQFGNNKTDQNTKNSGMPAGLIENPLLVLLRMNFIMYPTATIRKEFLSEHGIYFPRLPILDSESLFSASTLLWTEIAKHGGQFYVDTQFLMYDHARQNHEIEKNLGRPPEADVNNIIDFLVDANKEKCPELHITMENFRQLQDRKLMTFQDVVYDFFHNFFFKNRNYLIT